MDPHTEKKKKKKKKKKSVANVAGTPTHPQASVLWGMLFLHPLCRVLCPRACRDRCPNACSWLTDVLLDRTRFGSTDIGSLAPSQPSQPSYPTTSAPDPATVDTANTNMQAYPSTSITTPYPSTSTPVAYPATGGDTTSGSAAYISPALAAANDLLARTAEPTSSMPSSSATIPGLPSATSSVLGAAPTLSPATDIAALLARSKALTQVICTQCWFLSPFSSLCDHRMCLLWDECDLAITVVCSHFIIFIS